MSLELKRVEKKIGQDTHIYRTDLTFKKNTINILLGSTLAGKTTLMQIMAGLDKPTNGEIWFDNKNVTGQAVQKRNVSMVYQQFINYPNFTVFDNIASPLKITGINSDEIKKKVGEVAELLKLSGIQFCPFKFLLNRFRLLDDFLVHTLLIRCGLMFLFL